MSGINIGAISEALNDKVDRDLGNMPIPSVDKIILMGMPDYTNGQNVQVGVFTPAKNGILIVKAQNGVNQQFHLYLGSDNTGEEIAYGSIYAQQGGNTWTLPLVQGETYYITYSNMSCNFYPFLGV